MNEKELQRAINLASRYGDYELIEVFHRVGADVNAAHQDSPPLILAIQNGCYRSVKALLDLDADVDVEAVRAAIIRNEPGILGILLRKEPVLRGSESELIALALDEISRARNIEEFSDARQVALKLFEASIWSVVDEDMLDRCEELDCYELNAT